MAFKAFFMFLAEQQFMSVTTTKLTNKKYNLLLAKYILLRCVFLSLGWLSARVLYDEIWGTIFTLFYSRSTFTKRVFTW